MLGQTEPHCLTPSILDNEMATYLDLKDEVTNQLGADDANISVARRDKIINQARRQYHSEHRWSFLKKTENINLTNRVGQLPADYNTRFRPNMVFTNLGGRPVYFMPVDWDTVESYTEGFNVYAIQTSTNQIKINRQSVGTISVSYQLMPADRPLDNSQDNQNELSPMISTIALLAVAKWWLASERATGKYQLFKEEYDRALALDKASDMSNEPIVPILPLIQSDNNRIGV